jgi:pimeloyl-ACP methyl ester carboxylesterase
MATIETGAATIRYETWGDKGRPAVLMLAPGGLKGSRIEAWANAPWNPIEALSASGRYRVVGMDQRNTGTSFAPITAGDGWPDYAADQLALMDELGIERFGVMGMCIGGAFIMELIEQAPERITAAVAMQPIGLSDNRPEFRKAFEDWRAAVGDDHPEASDADWEGVWDNMYGGDEVLWSVPGSLLPSVDTPILVLQGNDVYHPTAASRLLAERAPAATLVERWKDPADQPAARAAVDAFLQRMLDG